MGLLDDAIREHLELKRLRGADPSEVARMEREALGPVRRGPGALDAPTEVGFDEREVAPADPDRIDFVAEFEESEVHEAPGAFEDDRQTIITDSPAFTAGEETAELDLDAVVDDERAEPDYRFAEHEEIAERAAESAHAPDEGQGDDVLEETPDFLQETPEHDRLWFEQQPPRDFDFDK